MKFIQLSIRTLCRFKVYTAINVIGLSLSLACVIFIFSYINQESSVDSYTRNKDRMGILIPGIHLTDIYSYTMLSSNESCSD